MGNSFMTYHIMKLLKWREKEKKLHQIFERNYNKCRGAYEKNTYLNVNKDIEQSQKRMLPEIRYMEKGTPDAKPVPSTSHVAIGFRSDWPCNQGKSHQTFHKSSIYDMKITHPGTKLGIHVYGYKQFIYLYIH